MTEVVFPPTGDAEAEGVVATWFAEEGEEVVEGDLIAEVAVDKVDMEITAPVSGVIRLLAEEGDVRKPGAVIARID
jgi:pyruvate/2-oxoglutarate dehydrogenase complex dihydrolipoamide acyltransferase (E2) component